MSPDVQPLSGDDCKGNVAPYVLGALPADEHEAFLVHLQSCAVCREEVAALQTVVATLPAAVPRHAAPAHLKQRVMAEVGREAQLLGTRAPQRDRAAAVASRRWTPVLAPFALGLAVIAALAIVLGGGGGGAGTRVIHASVSAPGASAYVRVSSGHAELTLANMPQTQPGRIYEVWVKRAGAPQPTDALFTVTSRGAATVGVPGSVAGVKEVLVTSEPLGGSRVPTRTPTVIAHLS
jgi:anti-sigma-K factor RskA